jgi:iron(III) transport system substrate-binding protein
MLSIVNLDDRLRSHFSMKRIILYAGLVLLSVLHGCERAGTDQVVVYVSEDQVFSEPVLKDFEKDSGIKVKAVFDTEEAKSAGVMNRLIAEKNNPQADVYWANEPIRAEVLKQMGIAAPYNSPNGAGIPDSFKDPEGYWMGFSARVRVLLTNKNAKDKPSSILAYTDPRFLGKAVIANPLFGTTTDEIAGLFTLWGDERARQFMEEMKKNQVKISTSNGESADMVASGEFQFALVDSDDAISRIRQGKPVDIVFPDQGEGGIGVLVVPNAVLFIKNAPRPENAKRLIDYLLSRETERKLAFSDAAQIPLHPGVEQPPEVPKLENMRTMQVDYARTAQKVSDLRPYLKSWTGS